MSSDKRNCEYWRQHKGMCCSQEKANGKKYKSCTGARCKGFMVHSSIVFAGC